MNCTGWRETARGGGGFLGLRSVCPRGKRAVEEAAQEPQLRLSQWSKVLCALFSLGSYSGSLSPFVHPSERRPAYNMPLVLYELAEPHVGLRNISSRTARWSMKPRWVSWGQMRTSCLHPDAPLGPLWEVQPQTSENNLKSSSRAQLWYSCRLGREVQKPH